jgi:putative membrane protein
VRTGLLAMASGIGAKALLVELLPQWLIIATGSVLVFFSAFCFGAAVWLVARRGFLTIGWNV